MKTLTHEDIDQMTEAEKLDLIDELYHSLEVTNAPLSPAKAAELDRRLANIDEEMAGSVSWEELKAELAARTAGA